VLTKKLWVIKLGGSSVHCGFRFEDENGKTCLDGEVTLVNVGISDDRGNIKAEAFNEEIKSIILKYYSK
jgi:4-hydroxybenzoyl-CoA thioesterase